MNLTPGTRLGPYEMIAKLGEGGMGEVYRAPDSNLQRSVAIKVLPAAVASDADRLARFQREAEVLAALNHPNIAAIYGLEKTPELTALVMELVEGEDLSTLINVGRGFSPGGHAGPEGPADADALAIARQIADGLEAAAYMAPEQARGRAVDRRADVWACGVVLYEMLTGQRAFEGEDVSVTRANVIKETPKFDALPPDLPAPIRRLLRRRLEKDPKRRLSSIGDARLDLEEAQSPVDRDGTGAATSTSAPVAAAVVIPAWRRPLPYAIASVVFALLFAMALFMAGAPEQAAPTPRRLLTSIGADASLVTDRGAGAIRRRRVRAARKWPSRSRARSPMCRVRRRRPKCPSTG